MFLIVLYQSDIYDISTFIFKCITPYQVF